MAVDASTSIVSQLKAAKRLPSPPGTALHVLELCRHEDTDVHEIADVIMADPALSVRLLRYANSATVGAGRKVASIRDAVLLLGLRAVKLTALGFSLATPDFLPRSLGFDLQKFWAESLAAAVIARRFAVDPFGANREEAFTAGLLAQIGRLALAHGLPDEYSRVLDAVRTGQPLIETERAILGFDHVEFGVQLLAEWELPEALVEAVKHQMLPLEPEQIGTQVEPLGQVVRLAIRLAPLFVRRDEISPEQGSDARRLVEGKLKLDEQTWQRITDEILSDYRQMAELFEVKPDGQLSAFDLYAEAQEEAIRVGMVAQLERTRALEENKDLLRRATTDALTGIANRAKFEERLLEVVAGLRRDHGNFALLLFDIDRFKKFNDAYGHNVGDLVLKHVARTAQSTLRDVDLLARYGGEEFTILAPNTDQRGACTVAARVRKAVENLVVNANGQSLRVTISVGLVLSSDYRGVPEAEQIMADVDKQLYLSKQAGRNTWSYLGRSASQVMRA